MEKNRGRGSREEDGRERADGNAGEGPEITKTRRCRRGDAGF